MKKIYATPIAKLLVIFLLLCSIGFNIFQSDLSSKAAGLFTKAALKFGFTQALHPHSPSRLIFSNYYTFNFSQVFPAAKNSTQDGVLKPSNSFVGEPPADALSHARYGAIELFNDKLLFVDGDGFSWIINGDIVSNGPFFAVPNHKSEFLKFIKKDFLGKYFGIKDVLVKSSGSSTSEVYVSTTDFDPNKKCYFISVFKNTIDNRTLLINNRDWVKLFETRPCLPKHKNGDFLGQSAGGRLAKGDNGEIYLSTGDFYFDGVNEKNILQKSGNDYGKVLLLPSGNARYSVIAQGLRNPQGLFFFKGFLYESEHGPQGGDEVNLIDIKKRSVDYGWPAATFGVDYGKLEWPLDNKNNNHFLRGFTTPMFSWIPSIGVSNLLGVYESLELVRWNGNLIVSSLKDQSLYRLVFDRQNRVTLLERINVGFRVRDLVQVGNIIYLLEDGDIPTIWKLSVKKDSVY